MSATQGAPAQRVPAWKRLGLKLKGAASDGSPAATAAAASHPAHANQVAATQQRPNSSFAPSPSSSFNKRKQVPSASYPTPDQGASKRFRREEPLSSPALRKQKSVSFADGTKHSEEPAKKPAEKQKKKPKKPKKPKSTSKSNARTTPEAGFSLEPALAYLRQWKTSRDTWKFNKNHQTLLIKYVFDPKSVPSSDITTFYAYIRDLKGFVRTRLRETAEEIRKKDMEQGAEGFPANVQDKAGKQQQYEEIVDKLLQQQRGNGVSSSVDEADIVMQSADDDVKQRVLKRMRAEMVVDELSDSGESSTTTGTGTTGAESSSQEVGDNATEKRVKLNDGSQRSIRRKRKLRTADDDSSSSESDSESDSDESSSSSSSSSGGSDDEMDMAPAQEQLETSSSSSSSSSASDSESGSEVATDEEDSAVEASDSDSD